MKVSTKRYILFLLSYVIGYVLPFAYFATKLGITKKGTTIVMPVVLLGAIAILKLCTCIPQWISTWKPSFAKGLIRAIPIYLLCIFFITLGLLLKYLSTHDISYTYYFEVILILFGCQAVGATVGALHLKYKELDLIEKGYVLGVVNKNG
jgi:hypothetical protein